MTPIPFDRALEEAELEAYLGPAYERIRLWEHRQRLEDEAARIGDEATLYRTSEAYLYELTAFAMTGTKLPYLRDLVRRVPRGASVLDYGCGIGSDGLLLLEAGYRVSFADFDNPSTRYLRWRLDRRGFEAPVHDLDAGPLPGGFDAAFAFDVIEHAPDPFELLARMERSAARVMVNLLEPEPGDTVLHHDLPIAALLDHATRRRLHLYRRYHGRSHLVLYEPTPARGAWRLRSPATRLGGRVRARLAGGSA